MLALVTLDQTPELFLPNGDTVPVPPEVLSQACDSMELECAVRWSYKAGLITHEEFLKARDSMRTDPSVAWGAL